MCDFSTSGISNHNHRVSLVESHQTERSMYFTRAAGRTFLWSRLTLKWTIPPVLYAPCPIHNHATWNFKRRTSQASANYHLPAVLVNMWSPVLGSLLGTGPTLIDCAVSYPHSCRKLARPNEEHLKISPEAFHRDIGVFLSVNDSTAFVQLMPLCLSPYTSGAQMLKQNVQRPGWVGARQIPWRVRSFWILSSGFFCFTCWRVLLMN